MTDVTALALAQVLAHCGGSPADAVRHLGAAIAAAPGDHEAYDQLAELWRRSQAEVAPVVEAGGTGGVVAALAFVRFLDGHHDEAVLTLGTLVGALPQVAWADAPWFGEPAFTGSVGADAAAEAVMRTADGGHDLSDAAMAPMMAPWFRLISAVAERAPVPEALARMAMVLRRCGRAEESLALCARADEVERVALTEVVRAGTFRVLGDVEGAVGAFERAIDLDPGNWSLHLDLADLLVGSGRVVAAIESVDRALLHAPDEVVLKAAGAAFRARHTGSPEQLKALLALLPSMAEGGYGQWLIGQACQGPGLPGALADEVRAAMRA